MTQEEILEAEKAVDARRESRVKGFTKMKERDRGWSKLYPLHSSASEVFMEWGKELGEFKLIIKPYGNKEVSVVLDAEELRKSLRWV